LTAADRESGRGGTIGIVEEDVVLVVDEGAVMAFEVGGRETPPVVGIGAAIVDAGLGHFVSQDRSGYLAKR
jgi:hypothetical protein